MSHYLNQFNYKLQLQKIILRKTINSRIYIINIYHFCLISIPCMRPWAWFCAIYLDLSCAASIISKILNCVCQCDSSLAYFPIKVIIIYSTCSGYILIIWYLFRRSKMQGFSNGGFGYKRTVSATGFKNDDDAWAGKDDAWAGKDKVNVLMLSLSWLFFVCILIESLADILSNIWDE